jgi:photosystem II stability/assembly factor-like uncharacterized protein
MSGRIGAVEVVVSNPDIMYVGAATGGLWKSTNGGVTWRPIMDDLPAASIGAVAVFQPAPDIVWVGTGEKARRNSAGVGTGLYRSLDAGETWQHKGLAESEAIAEILPHPGNQDIAYVAVLGKTWSDSEQRGVYKTVDGGETWERILYVNARTGAADLVMDPANPDKLIAAMWEHRRSPWFFESGGPGSGLYMTYDGGATWEEIGEAEGLPEGELGRIGLDFARSDPDVVYALVEAARSELLRSDDGGHTWRTMNDENNIAPRPFYYAQIRVDPVNENRVYNVHSLVDISEDGGRTFTTVLPFARVHPDHHAFWIHPEGGRLIVDGNDGGIAISHDRGESWRFVENLPLAQFYHISVDNEIPYNVYGGLQDNGSWQGPSQVWEAGGIRYYHWKEINFGDGFAAVVDRRVPRYAYAQSQGGRLVRSDLVTGERKDIRPAHPDAVPLRFNWNAALNRDPFTDAIYYGSQFVHRSRDAGSTWDIISPDLTTNDPQKQRQQESGGLTYDVTAAENHTTILTIAPSPVEQGVIWVGTDDGNVQVTRDGGGTWDNMANRIPDVPDGTWVPHIEPSKFEGGTAFVVLDDHRRGNRTPYVFRTSNYGRSWQSLVGGQIDSFVHVIEQDPFERRLLFVGTEFGMHVSFDGGNAWHLWTHGIPRVPVRAIVVHPGQHDLVVGTHGRGVYVIDDVRPLREIANDPSILNAAVHLFPIPPAIQYEMNQARGMRFLADAKYQGENRAYGAIMTFWVSNLAMADSLNAEVVIEDQRGNVVRQFDTSVRPGVNRVAWDLRRDGVRPYDSDDKFAPPGAQVLTGGYRAHVIVGGTASPAEPILVRPDPRLEIDDEARREKNEALVRVQDLLRTANIALARLDTLRTSLEQARQFVDGEVDSTAYVLRQRADALLQTVDSISVVFEGPQNLQGIVRRPDVVMTLLDQIDGSLQSSWEAPTEAQRIYLRQAENRLRGAIERLNRLSDVEVSEFGLALRRAGLQVFR